MSGPGDRTFAIWAEGYRATCESSGAIKLGTGRGATFREACEDLARRDRSFAGNFNPATLTFWGCRLFDNETDARKSFG